MEPTGTKRLDWLRDANHLKHHCICTEAAYAKWTKRRTHFNKV